jgi:hypothetical protein
MTRVHKLVVQFLNTCHIFISYIVVARRVATTFGLVCMDEHVY